MNINIDMHFTVLAIDRKTSKVWLSPGNLHALQRDQTRLHPHDIILAHFIPYHVMNTLTPACSLHLSGPIHFTGQSLVVTKKTVVCIESLHAHTQ